MQHDARKYLSDILTEINNIDQFTSDVTDFQQYEHDLRTQYAVEHALGIIGEATSKLKQSDPAITLTNLRQIIATRNLIVHAYESVDNVIIWAIITTSLSILKKEAAQLLAHYNNIKDESM